MVATDTPGMNISAYKRNYTWSNACSTVDLHSNSSILTNGYVACVQCVPHLTATDATSSRRFTTRPVVFAVTAFLSAVDTVGSSVTILKTGKIAYCDQNKNI